MKKILIVCFIFIMSLSFIACNDYTSDVIGDMEELDIYSDSMFPIFESGDTILYEEVDTDDIMIGDVIVFKDPVLYNGENDALVAHRVVDIYKNENGEIFFITKGDFNNTYDREPVPEANVVGIYHDVDDTKIQDIQIGDIVVFWHNLPVMEDDNNDSSKEYKYIDDKEALTYKVKEIKKHGDTFVVEKEFPYSVFDELEINAHDIIGVYTDKYIISDK